MIKEQSQILFKLMGVNGFVGIDYHIPLIFVSWLS